MFSTSMCVDGYWSITEHLRIGVTRNLYCDPDVLQNIRPPFDGQLMPANITLVERKYLLIQFTKLVDVYDATHAHIGYFYAACLAESVSSVLLRHYTCSEFFSNDKGHQSVHHHALRILRCEWPDLVRGTRLTAVATSKKQVLLRVCFGGLGVV